MSMQDTSSADVSMYDASELLTAWKGSLFLVRRRNQRYGCGICYAAKYEI